MSSLTREFKEIEVTIASSATDSASFAVADYAWGSVQIPGAFTGTTMTFKVSIDGTNFNALEDETGAAVASVPVSANEAVPLPEDLFKYKHAKCVSGSSEAAERTLKVFLKG